jgi:sugar lactone lactonase YvrE
MQRKRQSILSATLVLALALVALVAIPVSAAEGTTVATGFNGPQGVLVAPDGSVWVIDSGVGGENKMTVTSPETGEPTEVTYGDTARVVQVAADGTQTVAATLPSVLFGQEASGGSRLALLNGVLYASSGGWDSASQPEGAAPKFAAIVKIADGQATEVAQTWPLEKDTNPDGHILESHPYGLAAGADDMLYVADAGGNTALKVDPTNGAVSVLAVFAGLPGPMPNPARGGASELDPVPTGITFDQAGNLYVAFLPGAPFPAGAAKVVKVAPDGSVSDYAAGLSMVTDLRTGPDGQLYAVQMGQFTQQGPVPNSGSIARIKAGGASEVVLSGLSFPTSIDFNAAGDAYITTNGVGAPGSGALVMYAGLTSMAGSSAAAAAAPASLPTTGGTPLSPTWIAVLAGAALLALGLVGRRLAFSRARR